ncbi:hypothetical protein [Dyadobacter sp.]|uniref:hypothetical protein n=1 Tax=Dyadobacter sp. TaxID=1914288 RepID=UPI003F700954
MKEHTLIEQYLFVEEHRFFFHNIEPTIIGRIYKVIKGANAQYTWELSHYCRLEHEMSNYHPSAPFGETLEETRHKLMKYVARFEDAVDWTASE